MRRQFGRQRDELGFTLIELLIVIIILAILAGIVVFAVGTTGANAATSACQSDAQAVTTAVEEYKAAAGVYPGAVSLQIPQGSATPLTTYGQSWDIGGLQLPGTYGLLGDAGDPSNPAATWVAPNGATVGPFLRQLPSQTNYRIVTDGEGNVYVIPPPDPGVVTNLPNQGTTLVGKTVDYFLPTTGDTDPLNFAQDPAICSDPNVVK